MGDKNDGIYTLNEFRNKGILKLAPDFFVLINGQSSSRVIVSKQSQQVIETEAAASGKVEYKNRDAGYQKIDFRSGIKSMSTSFSNQPGSGSCNLSFVCPQYDSLSQNYYIKQPNGTKVPYFSTMMEISLYAKGRFMRQDGADTIPAYYPLFWGFVTSVNEAYNSNETTFSLTCRDMLGWWEYQNVNVVASPLNKRWGGSSIPSTGSLYRYMNPWEIILNLFEETSFANFIYPAFLKNGTLPPETGMPAGAMSEKGSRGMWELLAGGVLESWKSRFGLGQTYTENENKKGAFSNLEMFGISGILKLPGVAGSPFTEENTEKAKSKLKERKSPTLRQTDASGNQTDPAVSGEDKDSEKKSKGSSSGDVVYRSKAFQDLNSTADVDFSVLGRVLPFGAFDTYSMGSEPVRMSKLEVAAYVADSIHFEFFQDVNGMFVFKPPFFNMNTVNNPVYVIKAGDIISADFAEDSSQIVTFVEATGPILMQVSSTDYTATHADFGLMKRYGIRERTVKVAYGNSPEELRAMAASELAKSNARAFTANVTIAFRPEMRLGYPVYIDHMDTFYYVTNISHSITIGGNATTSLTMEAKRDRIYNEEGKSLRGYIQKSFETGSGEGNTASSRSDQLQTLKRHLDVNNQDAQKVANARGNLSSKEQRREAAESSQNAPDTNYFSKSMTPSERYYKSGGYISSPEPGFYRIVESSAFKKIGNVTSDTAKTVSNENPQTQGSRLLDAIEEELSELVHFTAFTLPYTDVNGFYHIGGFPYGANLVLNTDGGLVKYTNFYGNSMAFKAGQLDMQGKSSDFRKVGNDPVEKLDDQEDPKELNTKEKVSSDALETSYSSEGSSREAVQNIGNKENPDGALQKEMESNATTSEKIKALAEKLNGGG